MNLEYSGTETIPASKDAVWSFITSPAAIASCMPEVQSSTVVDDRTFDAVVGVAVGPVRGKFTFHVVLDPSPDRSRMGMRISGGGLGSVVDLVANADVAESNGVTTLAWKGTAAMRGPVASIGGRVIDAQAKRVIETTFANVKRRVVATAPGG
ncbi:MAG TPA: carbon monoxide dehydrogenase subunit G [Candidatus Baltobacteraceae bacterium]|nr:carbon monoxide dehydrogenase subunit G [Candidatus Baltobacteraceae bacterium]